MRLQDEQPVYYRTGKKINAWAKGGGGGSPPPPVKPKPIPAAPPPVQETSEDVQQANNDERQRLAKRKGRDNNILSGNKGVEGEAKTKKNTVLGGN
jgi:hypothetical protein